MSGDCKRDFQPDTKLPILIDGNNQDLFYHGQDEGVNSVNKALLRMLMYNGILNYSIVKTQIPSLCRKNKVELGFSGVERK